MWNIPLTVTNQTTTALQLLSSFAQFSRRLSHYVVFLAWNFTVRFALTALVKPRLPAAVFGEKALKAALCYLPCSKRQTDGVMEWPANKEESLATKEKDFSLQLLLGSEEPKVGFTPIEEREKRLYEVCWMI